jgi:hypothetical protein
MNPSVHCPDREKIFGLVHRLLEPAEEAAIRQHVFHCGNCLRVAQGLEKFDAVLGEWKGRNPSPGFDRRLKQKLPAHRPSAAFRFFALPSTRVFVAAMLVLLVVAGAYVINELPRPGKNAEEKLQAAKVQPPMPSPKPADTPLPDQSKLRPASKPLPPGEELQMYQNMSILENLDMLEGFDVLSELPNAEAKVAH